MGKKSILDKTICEYRLDDWMAIVLAGLFWAWVVYRVILSFRQK